MILKVQSIKNLFISAISRPLLISSRAWLALLVSLSTTIDRKSILLMFVLVSLGKAIIDRNESIRLLNKSSDLIKNKIIFNFLAESIPISILISLLSHYIFGIGFNFLFYFSWILAELLFSYFTLIHKKNNTKLLQNGGLVFLILIISYYIFGCSKEVLTIQGLFLVLYSLIINRNEIIKSKISSYSFPDFWLIFQSILIFSSKYSYEYLDSTSVSRVIEIILIAEVGVYLFNLIYPALRIFNKSGFLYHLPIIITVFIFNIIYHDWYIGICFLIAYQRIYFTSKIVNDLQKTKKLFYYTAFEFIIRLIAAVYCKDFLLILLVFLSTSLLLNFVIPSNEKNSTNNIL